MIDVMVEELQPKSLSGYQSREFAFTSLVDTLARRHQVQHGRRSSEPDCCQKEGPLASSCRNTTNISTKGLLNQSGDNSCFLNSTIQVLWHVDVFRNNFGLLSAHACTESSCLFCAFKVLFTQFKYSDHRAIKSDCLRKALAQTFVASRRFRIGLMDDAAECYEKILLGLHWHLAFDQEDECCMAGHCITHRKFTTCLIEQVICNCGWRSASRRFGQTVHYVSTASLIGQRRTFTRNDVTNTQQAMVCRKSFGSSLKSVFSGSASPRRCGRDGCTRALRKRRSLVNAPEVVNIGLVWDSDRADVRHIRDVIDTVDTEINIAEVFDGDVNSTFGLEAIVCYRNRHYCTFVHHGNDSTWTSLDDACIEQIGAGWSAVAHKICTEMYQPLLLVYVSKGQTQPITLAAAPLQTFFAANLHQMFRNASRSTSIRGKHADYEGGGSEVELQRLTPGRFKIGSSTGTDQNNSLALDTVSTSDAVSQLSVDVDACLKSASKYCHPGTLRAGSLAADGHVPHLTIPDWLTSVDDLSEAFNTRTARYIKPSAVEQILRLQGVNHLERTLDVTQTRMTATLPSTERQNAKAGSSSFGDAHCSSGGGNGLGQRCLSPNHVVAGDCGSDRRTSVSLLNEITTKVSHITVSNSDDANARRLQCYTQCFSFDAGETGGCWPRRLTEVRETVRKATCLKKPSPTPPVVERCDVDPDAAAGRPSLCVARKPKRVSFSDHVTTILMCSSESNSISVSPADIDEVDIVEVGPNFSEKKSLSSSPFCRPDIDTFSTDNIPIVDDDRNHDEVISEVSSSNVDVEDEGFVDESNTAGISPESSSAACKADPDRSAARCGLCQRNRVLPPAVYCADCAMYLSRLTPCLNII